MSEEPFVNTEIVEDKDVLNGPIRKPFNEHLQSTTSIHHDETAQKLGMRGGTIAGSYHMEQFVPLFMRAFGQSWFETGGVSLYFRNATTHLEPVQCFIRKPEAAGNAQVDIWMNHENGMLVAEGTASIGSPPEASALRERVNKLYAPGEVRILEHLKAGMDVQPITVNVPTDNSRQRFERITEPLDWYVKESPWGGPILTAPQMINALRQCMIETYDQEGSRKGVVGLFGALEFRYLNGPVFCDKDYINSGRIIAVGETPKTEYYWLEGLLEEPDTGEKVAESLIMIRIMKASSSLYPEL
ncbi:MAG: hypothetical protein JRG97_13585 [Deltaproteobacteria bacterium]|nr:hypothetical protein [Deltaproteobacteria bacterium]MBW2053404.1 hypothetical protein [Deltaproteobacteria bacterium]MBW2142077.1 hypothetical protein [Deltaproteobacteria bacterium]MBW2323899.1 hypothetical protein [Deltaproteobacteria bacterium]